MKTRHGDVKTGRKLRHLFGVGSWKEPHTGHEKYHQGLYMPLSSCEDLFISANLNRLNQFILLFSNLKQYLLSEESVNINVFHFKFFKFKWISSMFVIGIFALLGVFKNQGFSALNCGKLFPCQTSIKLFISNVFRQLWIELPWPENPANTYARRTETLDNCFDLIRSHQLCIMRSPPLGIELATTDCRCRNSKTESGIHIAP